MKRRTSRGRWVSTVRMQKVRWCRERCRNSRWCRRWWRIKRRRSRVIFTWLTRGRWMRTVRRTVSTRFKTSLMLKRCWETLRLRSCNCKSYRRQRNSSTRMLSETMLRHEGRWRNLTHTCKHSSRWRIRRWCRTMQCSHSQENKPTKISTLSLRMIWSVRWIGIRKTWTNLKSKRLGFRARERGFKFKWLSRCSRKEIRWPKIKEAMQWGTLTIKFYSRSKIREGWKIWRSRWLW